MTPRKSASLCGLALAAAFSQLVNCGPLTAATTCDLPNDQRVMRTATVNAVTRSANVRHNLTDGELPDGLLRVGNAYYFVQNHQLVKGDFEMVDQHLVYFAADDGHLCRDSFQQMPNGFWIYADASGVVVDGPQTIHGQQYRFFRHRQSKGGMTSQAGHYCFDDPHDGKILRNQFVALPQMMRGGSELHWLYVGDDGLSVTGCHHIGQQTYYFDSNGYQVKGSWVADGTGYHYYMSDSGARATNTRVLGLNGQLVAVDGTGNSVPDKK